MYMEEATRLAIQNLLERYDKANMSLDNLIRKGKEGKKIESLDVELVKQDFENLEVVIPSDVTIKFIKENELVSSLINEVRKRYNKAKTELDDLLSTVERARSRSLKEEE